ncbi:hypothetical protein PAXRUDRAFT_16280 [Paxillus rubicundulus Ve08.2h10]|uniref:Uncharacterized protein n=1 Tax=Paxillus rubicundulus Ve08.2h10 TaxID=930991 RepID=A0A0D0D795_9AGAM|nr:hypothetical protein PAXRUDRAFT_16280 [Paxillus rubicundulus Ve08.2h10]
MVDAQAWLLVAVQSPLSSIFIPNWKEMEVHMWQLSHDEITEEKLQLPQGIQPDGCMWM